MQKIDGSFEVFVVLQKENIDTVEWLVRIQRRKMFYIDATKELRQSQKENKDGFDHAHFFIPCRLHLYDEFI